MLHWRAWNIARRLRYEMLLLDNACAFKLVYKGAAFRCKVYYKNEAKVVNALKSNKYSQVCRIIH